MEQFNGINDGDINISDIIDVIQTTDPDSMATIVMDSEQPRVEILEQPASKALRFRYECEGRSAGSIPGVNSTPENKTFPSIRIVGYKGRAMVVVSCVTKDAPYRPHPHNLVGKEVCKQGVCTVEIPSGNMVVTFSNLGIQCVKKKDIEEALRMRQELRVDPFRTGFEHRRHPTNIDLNAVRLCFQVFLEGSQKGKFNKPLAPIVSDPIYDKKAMSDLVICKLSHCSAPVAGGINMILLCEKVAKEDIQVRFFEERDGQLIWEGYGDFQPTHVHKQTAIAFRTPSYRTQEVEQPVQAFIQLRRPSDGATSEPLPFQMLPLGTDDANSLRRKIKKINNNSILTKQVAESEKSTGNQLIGFNIIKAEPIERIPLFGSSGANTSNLNLQPIGSFSQPHISMQTLRPQMSPGRTPSPMDYNPPLVQQPYQPNNVTIMQQPNMLDVQFYNEPQLSDQSQLNQQELNLLLNKVTSENQDGLQPLNNIDTAGVSCLLDMDSQQYNLNWNSSDFADFGNLTANLSTGLSISDSIQSVNNVEERNMNERISWINVNQELSVLDNKILTTNRENNG
ncbi:PREDICTED: embryonic polarity protein dorsal isoform X2 [Trachymyrmex cornetzi]|uniref:Embryonic polarity protein dorsal n=1 Tax=Trachymyrmex cornetzi TaxID=471704 RepID=A0A151JM97_9HYME|nr:PREDICTED: embryonic polarity protein dorsal isoform X2 [Trachymyrmex cornetzi]KYN27449.1 Embryonic polarity protein dorsal [Trachymyrmex cornetzi]